MKLSNRTRLLYATFQNVNQASNDQTDRTCFTPISQNNEINYSNADVSKTKIIKTLAKLFNVSAYQKELNELYFWFLRSNVKTLKVEEVQSKFKLFVEIPSGEIQPEELRPVFAFLTIEVQNLISILNSGIKDIVKGVTLPALTKQENFVSVPSSKASKSVEINLDPPIGSTSSLAKSIQLKDTYSIRSFQKLVPRIDKHIKQYEDLLEEATVFYSNFDELQNTREAKVKFLKEYQAKLNNFLLTENMLRSDLLTLSEVKASGVTPACWHPGTTAMSESNIIEVYPIDKLSNKRDFFITFIGPGIDLATAFKNSKFEKDKKDNVKKSSKKLQDDAVKYATAKTFLLQSFCSPFFEGTGTFTNYILADAQVDYSSEKNTVKITARKVDSSFLTNAFNMISRVVTGEVLSKLRGQVAKIHTLSTDGLKDQVYQAKKEYDKQLTTYFTGDKQTWSDLNSKVQAALNKFLQLFNREEAFRLKQEIGDFLFQRLSQCALVSCYEFISNLIKRSRIKTTESTNSLKRSSITKKLEEFESDLVAQLPELQESIREIMGSSSFRDRYQTHRGTMVMHFSPGISYFKDPDSIPLNSSLGEGFVELKYEYAKLLKNNVEDTEAVANSIRYKRALESLRTLREEARFFSPEAFNTIDYLNKSIAFLRDNPTKNTFTFEKDPLQRPPKDPKKPVKPQKETIASFLTIYEGFVNTYVDSLNSYTKSNFRTKELSNIVKLFRSLKLAYDKTDKKSRRIKEVELRTNIIRKIISTWESIKQELRNYLVTLINECSDLDSAITEFGSVRKSMIEVLGTVDRVTEDEDFSSIKDKLEELKATYTSTSDEENKETTSKLDTWISTVNNQVESKKTTVLYDITNQFIRSIENQSLINQANRPGDIASKFKEAKTELFQNFANIPEENLDSELGNVIIETFNNHGIIFDLNEVQDKVLASMVELTKVYLSPDNGEYGKLAIRLNRSEKESPSWGSLFIAQPFNDSLRDRIRESLGNAPDLLSSFNKLAIELNKSFIKKLDEIYSSTLLTMSQFTPEQLELLKSLKNEANKLKRTSNNLDEKNKLLDLVQRITKIDNLNKINSFTPKNKIELKQLQEEIVQSEQKELLAKEEQAVDSEIIDNAQQQGQVAGIQEHEISLYKNSLNKIQIMKPRYSKLFDNLIEDVEALLENLEVKQYDPSREEKVKTNFVSQVDETVRNYFSLVDSEIEVISNASSLPKENQVLVRLNKIRVDMATTTENISLLDLTSNTNEEFAATLKNKIKVLKAHFETYCTSFIGELEKLLNIKTGLKVQSYIVHPQRLAQYRQASLSLNPKLAVNLLLQGSEQGTLGEELAACYEAFERDTVNSSLYLSEIKAELGKRGIVYEEA